PSQAVDAPYYGRDAVNTGGTFIERESPLGGPEPTLMRALATGPTRRTYRLALASDPSYATASNGASFVTAAKVALMTRVDQVYEDDLSIHMTLIANNDSLNFNTNGAMTTAGYSTATPVCGFQTLV